MTVRGTDADVLWLARRGYTLDQINRRLRLGVTRERVRQRRIRAQREERRAVWRLIGRLEELPPQQELHRHYSTVLAPGNGDGQCLGCLADKRLGKP